MNPEKHTLPAQLKLFITLLALAGFLFVATWIWFMVDWIL